MPIKPVVASLDDLPEPIREFYAPKGGKFVLELDGATENEAKLGEQVQRFGIDDRLRTAASRAGVPSRAVEDAVNRGRQVFRVVDGKVVARNGEAPVFGPNGRPLSMDDWADSLSEKAPHLFEAGEAAPGRPVAEAPKPASGPVVSGLVKRRDFDAMDGRGKRRVIDAINAKAAKLVD